MENKINTGFINLLLGLKAEKEYQGKKRDMFEKMKGGLKQMETKSRYEVIADLEQKKRDLIMNKQGLGDKLKEMERALKEQEREVEDQKEEIKYFKDKMKEQADTYDELIKSVDASLERFANLSKK